MTPRRILGTPSPRRRVDVATGGDPVRALIAALAELAEPTGAVGVCHVGHDLGCPCLAGRPIGYCSCEIVSLTVERLAA